MTSTGSSSKPWAYNCAQVGVSRTCATLVYIPTLLRSTFLCYSGLHSCATPVHTPVLLQSTTGLDRTPLNLLFDRTCTRLDMGSSCHSSVTYVPIPRYLYLLVPSLFPAHIYLHLPISTSVIFASHWQWLRYASHLLISSLLTYYTSLGTYCPLSSVCQEQVQQYIKHCQRCQKNKATNKAPAGELLPLPTPQGPWQDITVDFTEMPESLRYNNILVVVDRFSKEAVFI